MSLETYTLSTRLTNRYVGSCDYLDSWKDIGTATLLSRMSVVDEEDICEHTETTLRLQVEVESDVSEDTLRQALYDSFTKFGCAHTHDCCGCWSTYVASVFQQEGVWIVVQHSSRNY